MIENKTNNNKKKSLSEMASIQIKEEALLSYNNINYNIQKIEPSSDIFQKKQNNAKNTPQNLKNSLPSLFSKAQTKSREFDKTCDIFGNIITHGGKQKISFIDKISKYNFVEIIKIDNYKEYNKMEEVVLSNGNG